MLLNEKLGGTSATCEKVSLEPCYVVNILYAETEKAVSFNARQAVQKQDGQEESVSKQSGCPQNEDVSLQPHSQVKV